MISAVDALALPCAALSADERAAVDALEGDIDTHIRTSMTYAGCEFTGKETRPPVLAALLLRIRTAGYAVDMQYFMEKHRLNAAAPMQIVGFQLRINPSGESYAAAARASLQ